MSSPWTTPAAGTELPPRNANVQYYSSRAVYPRNVVTGDSWQVGKECVFQFESDPASGWLVPDQTKLYMKFRVSAHDADIATAAGGRVPSKAIRLAACPLLGMFDGARWSMNGTTVQSVAGDLDTIGQLQLRMRGSRESQDTNGSLGADSLRQSMVHPDTAPQTSALANDTLSATTNRFMSANGVYANDKHKLCTDRCENGVADGKAMELMTPVSMALTSFGINKFISGASHDLRFTIGQHGVDGKKSFYTREVPGAAADSGSVLSGTALKGNDVDISAAVNQANSHGILTGVTAADAAGVTRTVSQFQPPIAAYAAAANGLKITVDEIYLSCVYCLPVHGTVPRPLSSQFVYDNITLLQEPYDPGVPMNKQITIPVNTTRIVIAFRDSDKGLAVNRELLGKMGGLLSNSVGLNELGYQQTPGDIAGGSVSSLSMTLSGITLPQPAYEFKWAEGDFIRAWNDWGSFLQSSVGNTNGAQSLTEYSQDPMFAFRIMGDSDSVAQNLQVRATFKDTVEADKNREMLVFCLGSSVIEMQYDDDASFQPTSVSVQEVV
jgi:hypothetical protein